MTTTRIYFTIPDVADNPTCECDTFAEAVEQAKVQDGTVVDVRQVEAYGLSKSDSLLQRVRIAAPRTVLVHLNISVPTDDDRDAENIAKAIEGALEVGSDDPTVSGLAITVALAEVI